MTRELVKADHHLTTEQCATITSLQVRQLLAQLHTDGKVTRHQLDAWRLRAGGETWDVIARVLRCSVRSARTHVDRANQALLDHMGQHG